MRQSIPLFLLFIVISIAAFAATGYLLVKLRRFRDRNRRRAVGVIATGCALIGVATILGGIINHEAAQLTQDIWFGFIVSIFLVAIGGTLIVAGLMPAPQTRSSRSGPEG
jgi:hypothetical protein